MAGRWLSPDPTVSPTNTADRHDITEILLKVESYKFTIRTQTNEKRKNASHERYEKYTKRTHDTRTNESLERNHILSNDKRSWFYRSTIQYRVII